MSDTVTYHWAEASKETLDAMRLRCEEEGHCFGRLEMSNGVVVKRCKWCPAQVGGVS